MVIQYSRYLVGSSPSLAKPRQAKTHLNSLLVSSHQFADAQDSQAWSTTTDAHGNQGHQYPSDDEQDECEHHWCVVAVGVYGFVVLLPGCVVAKYNNRSPDEQY